MVKMTFTLDPETVVQLNRAAERLDRPKSEVVREAIREYANRADRLSDAERRRMLRAFDELVPLIPPRRAGEAAHELAEIRAARRSGGRRSARRAR